MNALPNLADFNASWSNRNGGEVLVTGGSLRTVMSAALAQTIVDKLSRALSVPTKAAEMAGRPPLPEPERIACPDTFLADPLRFRKGALMRAHPSRAARLNAVTLALEHSDAGAEIVAVAGVYFTRHEAEQMRGSLSVERIGGSAN
jgi:hypothetical protein